MKEGGRQDGAWRAELRYALVRTDGAPGIEHFF